MAAARFSLLASALRPTQREFSQERRLPSSRGPFEEQESGARAEAVRGKEIPNGDHFAAREFESVESEIIKNSSLTWSGPLPSDSDPVARRST